MHTLIKVLIRQHIVLSDKLLEIKKMDMSSPQAKKLLGKIKELLLAHLMLEDEELYPVLRKRAETDLKLEEMLDKYATDMDIVSQKALHFFQKYEKDDSHQDFEKDCRDLIQLLCKRIASEEAHLYKAYSPE